MAEQLGVSRSAVSRAFSEDASIHPEKRALILETARQLGYQPNLFASLLSTPTRRQRSHLVAILVSDFSNPYQAFLFEELSTHLQRHGKQPMLLSIKEIEDLDAALLRLSSYQVDGVIAVVGSLPAESINQCLKLALPLVTLGRADPEGRVPSVQTDNLQAGRLAAEHLLSLGLTRLGFVAGRADGEASNARYQGFADTIGARGLPPPCLLEAGRYGYSAGFATGVRDMARLRELEGIFCASDALAMGLLDSCREVGQLAIPQQLRVIGCDDVPQAAWQGYQLSSVAQPVSEIAAAVLTLLQAIWNGEASIPAMTRVPPRLQLRRSA